MKRKLPNFQVLRVVSRTPEGQILMKQVDSLALNGAEMPEGCFDANGEKLILPKRKRGEKFVVHYTRVYEAIF